MRSTNRRHVVPFPGLGRQRGMAVVLMMLMTGLAVTATVLGTASTIRGTQTQHLAVHTQTQAQLRAWSGVEVVRRYLGALPQADLESLATGALAITGLPGVAASIVSNTDMGAGRRRVLAHVTGSGAGANSTVEVVFEGGGTTTPPVSSGTGGINAVTIRRDLLLTGNITVTGNTSANLTVEGNAVLRGSVSGVNRLCTVKDENGNGGDLEVHSAISVNYVCVEGDLELTGGSSVGAAEVSGNVLLSGGNVSVGSILSNGDVTLSGGSARSDRVRATGTVRVSGGSARATVIETESDVVWTSSGSATDITANGSVSYTGGNNGTAIRSIGDVTIGSGFVSTVITKGNTALTGYWGTGITALLEGEGNLSWNNGGNVVGSGTVGGNLSGPTNGNIRVNRVPGFIVDLPPVDVPTYEPEEVPPLVVDVYPLRATANYIFEVDQAGRRKVTVQGVNDIPDGTYFLGDYGNANGRGYKDFLCLELKANNRDCLTPATPFRTICEGYSTSNGCLGYNNGLWTLAGKSMAPGVAWFDGNLRLSNGIYFNTFLAMGDIETGGSMRVYSINYAGYAPICANDRSAVSGATASPADFAGMYPRAWCNTQAGTLNPATLGNSALIAGGYRNGSFEGGDIALGASNQIFGSVIAGNVLGTNGNTDVTGRIIVAAQDPSATQTRWTGSTTVRIPTDIPNFDPGTSPFDPPTPTPGTSTEVRISWTRYL